MPFTISHLAAVMPFSRRLARWDVLSAVVIGAMVPDFHLLTPWHLPRSNTHTVLSLFTWCLPVGLLVYWLFQYLIKRPMIELLGGGAYERWQADRAPRSLASAKQWLLATTGVLIGAISHDLWDAFTHEGGRGTRFLAILDEPWFDGRLHKIIALRVAQDASSILGLILVLALLAYGLRAGPEPARRDRALRRSERLVWILTYCAATAALGTFFYFRLRIGELHPHWIIGIINDMAVASLRALATTLMVFSIALQLRLRGQDSRT